MSRPPNQLKAHQVPAGFLAVVDQSVAAIAASTPTAARGAKKPGYAGVHRPLAALNRQLLGHLGTMLS
jgi:hypothetical protein